jgi:hypothetical protein
MFLLGYTNLTRDKYTIPSSNFVKIEGGERESQLRKG